MTAVRDSSNAAHLKPNGVSGPDFRALFEAAPGLYLVLLPDPDFTIIAVSNAYARATMTQRDKILGHGLFEIFPDNPHDPGAKGVENLRTSLKRVLATRAPDTMKVQKYDIRRPESEGGAFEVRYWSPVNIPVLDEHGHITAIIHQVEDVTETLRLRTSSAEQKEALREHEQRFRLLVESVRDYGIFMLDTQGRVSTWNEGAKRITGYEASEIIGSPISIFFNPAKGLAEHPLDELLNASISGKFEDEGWRLRKDGSSFWSYGVVTAIRDEQGVLMGYSAVIRDLSEHKRAEDLLREANDTLEQRVRQRTSALAKANEDRLIILQREQQSRREAEESEQLLRSFANSIPQLAWMANPDGHIFWYNSRWYEYTGTTPGQMEGWGWQSVHDPRELPKVLKAWKEAISTGEPGTFEFPLKGANGAFRWFLTRVTPAKNTQGQVTRWFGTNTDVEELRKIRNDLEKAVRARDEFLAIASHELKTPLTSLKLQAQVRRRQLELGNWAAFSPSTLQKLVEDDIKQITRLARLVDDMLDISRLASGRFQLVLETSDLCSLVQEVAERFAPQLQTAGITLTLHLPRPVVGRWDRYAIEQVFTNLVTNALKYGDGKPIQVSVTEQDGRAHLTVKDQGIGIATKDRERIFGQFERAVSSSGISGLGLGLFISKQMIELHGGSITVESQPGAGSEFVVKLPLKNETFRA